MRITITNIANKFRLTFKRLFLPLNYPPKFFFFIHKIFTFKKLKKSKPHTAVQSIGPQTKLGREGEAGDDKKGPNNARHIAWALGC